MFCRLAVRLPASVRLAPSSFSVIPATGEPFEAYGVDWPMVTWEKSGAVFVGPKQTSLANLPYDLAGQLGPNPQDQTVYIRADKEVKYNAFMTILNKLQTTGYYKVSLITEDRT